MMINSVDTNNDLFEISEIFSKECMENLKNIDFYNLKYDKVNMQENLLRRKLDRNHSIFTKFRNELELCKPVIIQALGVKRLNIWDDYYLDLPGFTISRHPDHDSVKIGMQIYLNDNDENLGTVFFDKNYSIRKKFLYLKNTGYLMINKKQSHEMLFRVPKNTFRLSCYCNLDILG